MSVHLRREQCCGVIGCTKPATELGGFCGAHWRGLSPATRATLQWEAAWAVDIPEPDVMLSD